MLIELMVLGIRIIGKVCSTQEIVINSFLIISIGYLAYMWCWLKERMIDEQKSHRIIGGLVTLIGRSLTCLGAGYYVIKQYIMTGIMTEILCGGLLMFILAFAYVFMFIKYRRAYDNIINLEMYVFVIGIGIVGCFFKLAGFSMIGLAFVTVIGAICRNQSSIDYLLERTQKNTPMVKQLRRSNMKWVLATMLFLIIAYVLKGIVVSGLYFIGDGLLYVLRLIMRLLFRVKPQEEVPLDLSSAEMGAAYNMGATGGENSLYKLIICGILLIICIIKRREICIFIKRLSKAVILRIKAAINWLEKVIFHVENKEDVTPPYYSQHTEEINEIENLGVRQEKKISKRKLERKLKVLNKITDSTLQYRKKYKLLIEILIWRGVEIKKSHTPRQIYSEVLDSALNIDLQEETRGYEDVRYGEMEITQDKIKTIDEHLKYLIDPKREKEKIK